MTDLKLEVALFSFNFSQLRYFLDRSKISCGCDPVAISPKHDPGIALAFLGHGAKNTSIDKCV